MSRRKRYRTPVLLRNRKLLLGLIAAFLLLAALAAFLLLRSRGSSSYTLPGTPDPALTGQKAEVHFIDVGQADSTLLRQGKSYTLIDAGTTADGEVVLAYLQAHGVQRLQYLVLTHFHADHIGGALDILENIPVDTVLLPDLSLAPMPTSSAALRLLEELDERSAKGMLEICVPAAGDAFPFGGGSLEIVGAGLACEDDANNTSLITLFHFGNFTGYFGGDSEAEAELALLAEKGSALHADLYKVAHHGSVTSSTPELVQQLAPQAAVVSCGWGNDYGHPHEAVLRTLKIAGADCWRTDEHGTVTVTVKDGTMTVKTEKGG